MNLPLIVVVFVEVVVVVVFLVVAVVVFLLVAVVAVVVVVVVVFVMFVGLQSFLLVKHFGQSVVSKFVQPENNEQISYSKFEVLHSQSSVT